MLLSRADEGRSVALESSTGDARARASVGDQLDLLLGEQLLPLRARTPGADEPHLLAVDAAGQLVVVEVVGLLDDDAVLRALRHAGRAARMSSAEIAAAYSGGAERFAAHFEAFRETVPATALLSPSVRVGSRLLLVCSEVDPGVDDALEFLLQPGWQVEVLQVRVSEGPSGGRLVDVVPVDRAAPPRPDVVAGRTRDRATARSAAPSVPVPVVVPPPFAVTVGRPLATVTPLHGPRRAASPDGAAETRAPVAEKSAASPVDPRLATLAARWGEPVVLTWTRLRRGERYEALLHVDGMVELPDGTFWTDVDAAAEAACGSAVDGWRVWRVGDDDGPSLAEAAETWLR